MFVKNTNQIRSEMRSRQSEQNVAFSMLHKIKLIGDTKRTFEELKFYKLIILHYK